ncbi:MAG TPA: glycoside hydrolase family 15 protein [Gallionella sp.]|nr:glycoside hydrolase family 15 protein [Gallionella sp.]
MFAINNNKLSRLIKESYSFQEVQDILSLLHENNTFFFSAMKNGLFPAAQLQEEAEYTGYSYVWVRDNIYIDYAHYLNGQIDVALKSIKTFAQYFIKHKWRFEKIIAGSLDFNEAMNRPHIRFNGNDLSEIRQKWAHAENDALGYFVWLFSKLSHEGYIQLTEEEKELLALFAFYFEKIRYWEDEDSGHWEEKRKIEASSIGVVVGALEELKTLLKTTGNGGFSYQSNVVTPEFLDNLIAQGRNSLDKILPAECIQDEPEKKRRYDAALLFLIFPMKVVAIDAEMADQILSDVIGHLLGDHGIRRYIGDSFWAADYKKKLEPDKRTIDVSDDMSKRDSLLKTGEEAQWCIFDPIISVIYGLKYQKSRNEKHLELQTHYFNRSLGQLTAEDSIFGALKCPELYYLEDRKYVPNDTVPLLWTQANLWMAFRFMNETLSLAGS